MRVSSIGVIDMSLDLGVISNECSSCKLANTSEHWRNKPTPGLPSMEESLNFYVETEYGDDILLYQLRMEQSNSRPDLQTMDQQPEITWEMRACLVDFIMIAHSHLQLSSESFFLTVNIIDRYCSRQIVDRSLFQLLGCCALLLAFKFHDTNLNQPSIKELQQLCDNFYPKKKFLDTELKILKILEWNVDCPTVNIFLDYSIYQSKHHMQRLQLRTTSDDFFISNHQIIRSIAYYLCEIFMLHRSFFKYPLSIIACCANVLSLVILSGSTDFPPLLSTLDENSCLNELLTISETPSENLRAKYSSDYNFRVANIVEDYYQRLSDYTIEGSQYYGTSLSSEEMSWYDQCMYGSNNYEYAGDTANGHSSQFYQNSEYSSVPRTSDPVSYFSNAIYKSSATISRIIHVGMY